MLIKENQLLQKFKEQNINYVPLLLYGPNEGLMRENYTKLKDVFNQTNFEEINLIGKAISEQPEILIDEIKTVSMFNDHKIITIDQPLDKNVETFEEAFQILPKNTLVIVLANNLKKTSKIRKFF